ncbi:hypothetical protein TIFTF001_020223 [Ficus carica]|uniref:Uncharacterized protein n=1 Tax=Ficus carica TaxID=3494 RepID=A0AA88ATT0_FICCA|nr:hypothetical protein TIFTF001_020223 [Ficus carica]
MVEGGVCRCRGRGRADLAFGGGGDWVKARGRVCRRRRGRGTSGLVADDGEGPLRQCQGWGRRFGWVRGVRRRHRGGQRLPPAKG